MLRIIFVSICMLFLSSCSFIYWDQREEVAYSVLTNKDGDFDKKALSAAISTIFINKKSIWDLQVFVENLSGKCKVRDKFKGTYWCEIPTRGGFCWGRLIGLDVVEKNSKIQSIEIAIGGLSC